MNRQEAFDRIADWIELCGREFAYAQATPETMRQIAHSMARRYYVSASYGRDWPVSPVPFSVEFDEGTREADITPCVDFLEWLAE